MIETQGIFIREKNLLRFVCPCCGNFQERLAPHRISTGATLRTTCEERKLPVMVVVSRCI